MIKNTHLYNIVFSRDDYMEVLMKLENHQDSIYPVKAKKVISNLDHATSMEDRNPYNEVLDELYNVMDVLHIERVDRSVQSAFLNVREILDYISEIHQKLDDINEIKRGIKKDYYENQEAIELLSCLNRDRISIDDIHELKYVALRFGKLPLSQIEKIKYFDSYPFVYQELSHTDQFAWIVYGGVEHSIGEIDNIFSSMNFEEVKLPKFAHGKMEEAVAELKAEDKTMEAYLQELDQRIEKVKEENEEQLLGDFWKTYRLKELYKKGKYVVDLKTKAAVYAFSSFNKNELEDIVNVPGITIHELPIDTYQDQGIEGPVYVENYTFFQPFECLFTFKPGEKFDPTVIAGVVMMLSALVLLGDLGVGVLAILLSFIIKGNISKLLQRVGAAVTIGGLLSGTVFYSMSLYNSIFVVGTNYAMQIGLFFVINIALLLVCSLVKKVTKRSTKSKGGLSWQ
jgi:vacuolar-type H+-ATPase subunit I/STV1